MKTTKENLDRLRKRILAELKIMGDAESIHFKLGHCRKGGDYFKIELQGFTILPDGTISDPEKHKFELYAKDYNLKPEFFGREFISRGSKFRISGINPKAPRYPVNGIKLTDGAEWKFTVPTIISAMKQGVSTS